MQKFEGIASSFSILEEKNHTLLSLSGKVFTEYDDLVKFQKQVLSVHQKKKDVVLDLSGVTYINSQGIKEIISLHKNKQKKGYRFVIAGARDAVKEVLEAMNLSDEIKILPDPEAAFEWLSGNE